jgi:hypothetical protein
MKMNKKRYVLVEASDNNKVEVMKIIAPEEISGIRAGILDERILELNSYEVFNPELSDKPFVVTVDDDSDEDDGIIISEPVAVTTEDDYDPEVAKEAIMQIIKKAIGDFVDVETEEEEEEEEDLDEVEDEVDAADEDTEAAEEDLDTVEDFEESLESSEPVVEAQDDLTEDATTEDDDGMMDESLDLTEAEDDLTEETITEADDFGDEAPAEDIFGEEDAEADLDAADADLGAAEDNIEGAEEDLSEYEANEEELSDVNIIENEDGSVALRGDVKSLLAAFLTPQNVEEVMKDKTKDLETDPTVKIESFLESIFGKKSKLDKLLNN